ncbi:hypothetical protein Mal52_49400 [Symmachiella dynata]|uniref:Uncharacterized protein n=1 Tax=Symmachiella dynata TaxID=2527995 RepID=A0A517ZVB0_9PLAN|nr:hypothetical protein Mal52_49400 [Symmachiella dynata]
MLRKGNPVHTSKREVLLSDRHPAEGTDRRIIVTSVAIGICDV